MDDIGLFEAIYSQRQFIRYKPDPVPPEAIERIIDAAIRAPNGGNRQPWEFIVVTDRDLIRTIGEVYRDVWLATFGATSPPDESRVYRAARVLAHHMPDVPAMIIVCADHRRGSTPPKPGEPLVRNLHASSIWLAVQNLFLAARALGLGTRLTTAHLRNEEPIRKLLRHSRPRGNDGLDPARVSRGDVRCHVTPSRERGHLLQSVWQQKMSGLMDVHPRRFSRSAPIRVVMPRRSPAP